MVVFEAKQQMHQCSRQQQSHMLVLKDECVHVTESHQHIQCDCLQARPYTHTNTYDENAVLAALFLEVLIVLLFFVISLILLLK